MTAAAALALAALTSCSVGSGGTAETSSDPAPQQSVDPALRVTDPRDLTGVQDACTLLNPEQRTRLGAGDAEFTTTTNEYGNSTCEIFGDAFNAAVDIDTNHGGITNLNSKKDNFDSFTPTEVAGYPAAELNAESTACKVSVGIADDQSIEVDFSKNSGGSPEMNDPCGYAKTITNELLVNIPK
ncbi:MULTISPECIES: DUF3558 domain-containing protein [unclassified Saccharopolyspora]|uniref:DUF3558 domain-containing protein n=1 Tax=unclassified Saccharopolyspora TaxID=2646250 RepID=UPI001CD768DA|nr:MULTISPECIES: DUF3558 domain-containing protein [unclassified Saccharopolyspora]MCA1190233.1 DUF3558 domain-containing protein [Saccharopolyspora sp. 6T]MCA1280056.1 DUF3558 domain-containing protein [Saccharopolyspora sp. 7B]